MPTTTKRPPRKSPDAITQKQQSYFSIYALSTSKTGRPDMEKERRLSSMAKKYGGVCTGSGTDLETGVRDLSFIFPTKVKAAAFMCDAVKARLLQSRVGVRRWELDWVCTDSDSFVHYRKLAAPVKKTRPRRK